MQIGLWVLVWAAVRGLGRIGPRSGRPIEPSVNNRGRVADYRLHFRLATDTIDDHFLFVKFPEHDFPSISANSPCSAFLVADGAAPLSCRTDAAKWLKIGFANVSASRTRLITVLIGGITNPASALQGTGHFKLEVRKGDQNVLAFNHLFGSLAFEPDPLPLGSLGFSVTGSKVINQLSSYKLTVGLNPAAPGIKAMSRLTVRFPGFIAAGEALRVSLSFQSAPTFSFSADSNTLEISGLAEQSGLASFEIQVQGLRNPGFSTPSGAVTVSLWRSFTNTIEQSLTVTDVDTFLADSFLQVRATNFGLANYVLSRGDDVHFEVALKAQREIPPGALLQLVLSSDFGLVGECWPLKGLSGVSEDKPVTCVVTGKTVTLSDFRKISPYFTFAFGLRAVNPGAAGTTLSQTLSVFDSAATMRLLYYSNSLSFGIQSSPVFSQLAVPGSTLPANSLGALQIDFMTPADLSAASALVFTVSLLSKDFAAVGGLACQFVANGVPRAASSCQKLTTGVYNSVVLSISATAFTQGTPQSLRVTGLDASSGVRTPRYGGRYAIEVKVGSSSPAENYHGTLFVTVAPLALDPARLTVAPFTVDYAKATTYRVSFYLPLSLPTAYWSAGDELALAAIELSLPTDSVPELLFDPHLGLDAAYGVDTSKPTAQIPCYGMQNLFSTDSSNPNYLRCVAYFPDAAQPTTARIRVDNFAAIAKEDQLELLIPNIRNPGSTTQAAQLGLKVLVQQRGQFQTVLSAAVTLPLMRPHNIFANPNNSNGALGVPTNQQPRYLPSVINSAAVLELKLVPSLPLAQDDGMFVVLPALPSTQPPSFLLPPFHHSNCTMNQVPAACFSFREANQLVVYFPQGLAAGLETTFAVRNCRTPGFVSNIQQTNRVTTFDQSLAEVEEIVLLPVAAFSWGAVLFSKVRPRFYEALRINVEYEWVFIVSNPIPAGGYVTLYFPANYYDLESSDPCPQVSLRQGLAFLDPAPPFLTDCTQVYKSSILTIRDIRPLELSGEGFNRTLVVVWVGGVKNPSQGGWTPYFGVTTHNREGFVIDRDLEVPIVYLSRVLSAGKITFKRFECVPDNGKLLSNYALEFYIETAIPRFGTIKVWFPNTEFAPGFSEEGECALGPGALATVLKCEFDPVFPLVTVTLDADLEIRPGMAAVSLFFPKVANFNADLSSGLVRVTTFYDGTVLDDSGQEETNRKATTKGEADTLQVNRAEFVPRNAAALATLTVVFSPRHEVRDSSFIELHFPKSFPRGLGPAVNCTAPDLLIGPNDPLNCTVTDYKLTVRNLRPNATCPCVFTLVVRGVVLPNYEFHGAVGNIRMYFFLTATHVGSFSDNIASLGLIPAPVPLAWSAAAFQSSQMASWTGFRLRFSCPVAASFDTLRIALDANSFPDIMDSTSSVSVDGGASAPVAFVSNFFELRLPAAVSLAAGALKDLALENVVTGFSAGETDFPQIGLAQLDGVVCQSYPNTVPQKPFEFNQVSNRLTLVTEEPIRVVAGTYCSWIKARADRPATELAAFNPRSVHNYTIVEVPAIARGRSETALRVGCPRTGLDRATHFHLQPGAASFDYSRPYEVFVDSQTRAFLKIDGHSSIVAGGFLGPVKVSLEFAPFEPLTVSILVSGSSNSTMAVFPAQLNFTNNDLVKTFYIFDYFSSKSAAAKLFFSLGGPSAPVYAFVNQVDRMDLKVVNGKETAPVLLDLTHRLLRRGEQGFSLTVGAQLDSNCVLYYAISPRGTMDVSFTEIFQKVLPYKFLADDVFFGMAFADDRSFLARFEVSGLPAGGDFKLKVFFINTDGVLGTAELVYFSTRFQDSPVFVLFELGGLPDASPLRPEEDVARLVSAGNLTLNYSFANATGGDAFERGFNISGGEYTFETGAFVLQPSPAAPETAEDPEEVFYNKYSEIIREADSYKLDEDFNPATQLITSAEYNYAEDLNAQNEFRNTFPAYADAGYSQADFEARQAAKDRWQRAPLKLMGAGAYYNREQRYHGVAEADRLFRPNRTTLAAVDNKRFTIALIWPDATLNQTTAGVLFDLETTFNNSFSQNSSLKTFHVYLPSIKTLRFADKSLPYIRKIGDIGVTIGGLAVEGKARLEYVVVEPLRTDYKRLVPSARTFTYFDPQTDEEGCLRSAADFLQVRCQSVLPENGTLNNASQYDVRNFTKIYELPTHEQVSKGLDPNNFRAVRQGSVNATGGDDYFALQIDGLAPATNYTVFLSLRAAEDGPFVAEIDQAEIVSLTFRTKKDPEVLSVELRSWAAMIGCLLYLIGFKR